MTAKQLLELLASYLLELRVVGNGYVDGFDDVMPECISVTRIKFDCGKHPWEGRHMTPGDRSEHVGDSRVVGALALRRASN